MEYYYTHEPDIDNIVSEKVRSLFVDVEVHEDKLWGVATIERTEPLTPAEYTRLKAYITGQYADGFGEGFEQRKIKVEGEELNVSLWSGDGGFFIETRQEFTTRLGIEVEAPEPSPEPEAPTPAYTLRAYIERPDHPDDGGFALPLPTAPDVMQVFLNNLMITDIHKVIIGEVYSLNDDDNNLSYWLNQALRDIAGPKSLDELSYLATKIQMMSVNEREVFSAAIQAKQHSSSLAEVINLTENLESYYLEAAAYSADIYGEFRITTEQDETLDSFNRLKSSTDLQDQRLAKLINHFEQCVDRADYAKMVAKEEGGMFTDYGYLRQLKEVTVKYRDIGDIPAEARLLPGNGGFEQSAHTAQSQLLPEHAPPYQIVTNTDLTTLVMQMHVLDGNFLEDAKKSFEILEARRNTHYLMFMTGYSVVLTEAIHLYRPDGEAPAEVFHPFHPRDVKVFALTIKDAVQGHLHGDLVEVDYEKLMKDVEQNGIQASHIDAKLIDGPDLTFTPKQWETVGLQIRGKLQDVVLHFSPDDLQAVRQHLDDMDVYRHERGMPIDVETFLSGFNEKSMQGVRNSQADMLRIPVAVATEMLRHKDTSIYSMVPEGLTELSPLDTLPSGRLGQPHYQGVAIKMADLAGLEKWADREITKITHPQPERKVQEHVKERSEPEI